VSINSSRFEAFSARDLPNLQRMQNGKMVPVKDPLASAARLTEIHMNRPGYEYIRTRALYNTDGQLRALDEHTTIEFPCRHQGGQSQVADHCGNRAEPLPHIDSQTGRRY